LKKNQHPLSRMRAGEKRERRGTGRGTEQRGQWIATGCDVTRRHATLLHSREARRAKEGGPGTHNRRCFAFPVFSRDSTSRFISIDGRGTRPDVAIIGP